MYLLVLVLDDPTRLEEVLEAWGRASVPGITVVESTGERRIHEHLGAQSSQFMGFSRLLRPGLDSHSTLFSVVPDMETAERAIKATEAIIGDLADPHTGIAFAVPVGAAWGINKKENTASSRATRTRQLR